MKTSAKHFGLAVEP